MNLIRKEVEKCDSLSGFHHNEYGWRHWIRARSLRYSELTRSVLKRFENESDYMALWNWWGMNTSIKNFYFVVFAIKTNYVKDLSHPFFGNVKLRQVWVHSMVLWWTTHLTLFKTLPSKWGVLIYKNSKEENCAASLRNPFLGQSL